MKTARWAWQWSPSIFACRCGDDLVTLDVRHGEYAVVAGAGGLIDVDAPTGRLDVADEGLAEHLSAAGQIRPTRGSAAACRKTAPTAAADIFNARETPLRPSQGWAFALALAEMIPLYWLRSFPGLVAPAPDVPIDPQGGPSDPLVRDALAFEKLLVWTPFQGQCLYRATILRRFLRRRGHHVDWVFGVRTSPFTAHCWLQSGGVVINDRLDHVSRFTALMVV